MSDTIVFDIETKNFFTTPGVGRDNFNALQISVVGMYSYDRDEYVCFAEDEMERIAEYMERAESIVGFSSERYDVPVLNLYLQRLGSRSVNLWDKNRIDLLEMVERITGKRISLSKLSEANLGISKDRHGSEAIALYNEGKIEELKEYCLKDVRLTKELYDIYLKTGVFLFPDRESGNMLRLDIKNNHVSPATLL